MRSWRLWLSLAGALALGCAPSIGDSCKSNFDCSVSNDRACDLASPNGSCTVFACEADNCPANAVCVRWRPDPSRLSFTACMQRCDRDTQCRMGDGYRCVAAEEITTTPEGGDPIAEVVDVDRNDDGRFCVATEPVAEEDM